MRITRDQITDVVEIVGAILITCGIGINFGLSAALITGGIFCLTFGYLAGK